MDKKTPTPSDYKAALEAIKNRVRAAQYDALKAVNRELISVYWDIGGIIVARQKNAAWGRSVVEQVAVDLRQEFPAISGFSASNLWRMAVFTRPMPKTKNSHQWREKSPPWTTASACQTKTPPSA